MSNNGTINNQHPIAQRPLLQQQYVHSRHNLSISNPYLTKHQSTQQSSRYATRTPNRHLNGYRGQHATFTSRASGRHERVMYPPAPPSTQSTTR